MNKWILAKVLGYLQAKEGCEVEPIKEGNASSAVITDAFGYRYQVEIKLITRLNDDPNGSERLGNTGATNFLAISKAYEA